MTGPQLRIDLDRFAANIAAVRATLAPAELMLVVKDDAYGHGLEPIVRRAVAEGVRWFGAFDVRAALATRAVTGPDARIFSWLTVGKSEIGAALAARTDLGVGDADFLEDIAEVAHDEGSTARVHLKIDTGLHRNGIRPEAWGSILERAEQLESAGSISVVGVWSHLAEASDADDDRARDAFDEAVRLAEEAGFALEVRHLAASAASFARPEFRYDLARVGAFCYGVRSAGGPAEQTLGVAPIASLVAPVTHVGDRSVTIGAGYLHGLPSTLGMHAGVRRPDGAIDILDVAEEHSTISSWVGAAPGMEYTVFGPGASSATDLAEAIGTVGEEILLRISPLVPRIYLGE